MEQAWSLIGEDAGVRPRAIMDMNYSLAKNFAEAVEDFRDNVAIETRTPDGTEVLTYGELGERVNGLAYFITSLGIKRSDRVGIILGNGPDWAVLFFALASVGAVAVPLDIHSSKEDVKKILSDSGTKVIFASRENQRVADPLKDYIRLITVEEIQEPSPPRGFKIAPIDPDDLMVLLYTSGTTDIPKGVMLTHKNLSSNLLSLKKMNIFSPGDIILSVLPLYHSYSLMTTLIVPICSGSRVVYVPADWPERLADYIKETKTTIFIGVPQIYHVVHSRMMKRLGKIRGPAGLYVKLAMHSGFAGMLLPGVRDAFGKRLRLFISGGARLDRTAARDFFKLGFKILEGYGLTETSPVVSLNPLTWSRVGSIGRPIPGVEMKIINKNADGIGEIAIKGPNVMKGYYNNEAKTGEVIKDGWFLSGDLGYEDRDGYFYITGRSKELIVLSSGKNIYPEELERHYSSTPYVKEMCVSGLLKAMGQAKTEYLHAIVVPDLEIIKERGEIDVRNVIKSAFDNLSRGMPAYKHIMGFTVTQQALPRTVLGKLKRYEIEKEILPLILEKRHGEKVTTMEDDALLGSDIAKGVIKCIREVLEIDGPIHLNDSIELDLGVDSLGLVELVLGIERYFNVEFKDEMAAAEIFTVKDIILKVEELIKARTQGTADRGQVKEKLVHWPDILKQSLPAAFREKISLQLGGIDYLLTFLIKGFIGLFFRVFYRLRVEGSVNIPKKGPYVLCVNHASFLDGFVVVAGVPFRTELGLFFIGFRRYFRAPIIRDLVKRARIIPIDASEIIEAMQGSSFILRHNKALCIFPEGERSIDGKIKGFRKGIGIIAKELDIPLIPVFIKGAFEAWPRTERFPRPYPIKIRFGCPQSSNELVQKGMALGAKDEYEAISLAIREELIAVVKDLQYV